MGQLIVFNALTDEATPVPKYHHVRLQGDGWYIDIQATDDGEGINLHSSGSGSPRLIVMPHVSNGVQVTTTDNHDRRVHVEATRIHEVWVANEKDDVFKKRKAK